VLASAAAGLLLPGLKNVASEGYSSLVGAGSSGEFMGVEGYSVGVFGKFLAGNWLPPLRFGSACECKYTGTPAQIQHLIY
jgi:hypothetical protein